MKILLEISYIGTNFHGWQVQSGCVCVQSTLQDACEKLFCRRLPVTGCSRTDAGVHAKKYFCTVEGNIDIKPEAIPRALNTFLPDDISVHKACIVPDSFHPRYSCVKKEYTYLIYQSSTRDPFISGRAWQIPRDLDISEMKNAASYIVGKHDFSAFCASGSDITDTFREVKTLDIISKDGFICIKISADGFLYNMVRIIAGTLCDIGLHKYSPSQVAKAIESNDRSLLGPTAPPYGLYLTDVVYDKDISELFNVN